MTVLVDGEATIFLFTHDVVASVARPVLELKGVRKIALAAGARGRVAWRLSTESLSFLGPDLKSVLEPGTIEIHVGQSADPADLLTQRDPNRSLNREKGASRVAFGRAQRQS